MNLRDLEALSALADRMERGAAELRADAADPAATLAGRGWTNLPADQVADFGRRHAAAADAASAYAAQIREHVAAGQVPTAAQLAQAERVADAANLDGILIDGRRQAEATAANATALSGEADKQAWESGTHPAQVKAAEVEGSGVFTHVAETINGIEQVPFWQLGNPDQLQMTAADVDEA